MVEEAENPDGTKEPLYQVTRYTYDLNGNKTKEEQGLSAVKEGEYPKQYHSIFFFYDKDGRLTCVKDAYGAKASYRYDCLNQKISETLRINETTEKRIRYQYDAGGRLIEKREELDDRHLSPKG